MIPPKPGSGLERTLRQHATLSEPPKADSEMATTPDSFWEGAQSLTKEEELARKRAWRAGPSHVEKLRAIARKYEGTHNFHNFTVARDFSDRSNQRHMKKIEVCNHATYVVPYLCGFRSQNLPCMGRRNGLVSFSMGKVSCFTR